MNKAVIYARFSCDKQSEQSIEGQIRICNEFAEKNNIAVIANYIDRAVSGKTDKRPNFIQLIEDSAKKQFDYVIVYKLDRFARSREDSAIYKSKLKANNVKVLSACEQITDSPEGIILESLIEGMAEYYSAELSQKTKRGIKQSIINGNFAGGFLLYGYKVEDKKILIDEVNAQAVKLMFDEYSKGTRKTEIVKILNKQGYLYNGKPFTVKNFDHKFDNTKYIGFYEYDGEQYNDLYPAIIDKSLFDSVQKMLKHNKRNAGANKAKVKYILSGKLFCGLCGNTMVGTSGKSRNKENHYYYTCSKRYKSHECPKEYEKKDNTEDLIFNTTLEFILKPKNITKIVNNAYEYFKNTNHNEELEDITQRITRIGKEMERCYNVLKKTESKNMINLVNKEIESFEIEQSDLEKQRNLINLSMKIIKSKEEIKAIFDLLLQQNHDKEQYRERIIKLFINSIFVFEDILIIYFNLFDNHPVTFEEMQEDLKTNFKFRSKEEYKKVDISRTKGSQLSLAR